MLKEVSWLIDQATGALTVEGLTQHEARLLTSDLLPSGVTVNCARPVGVQPLAQTEPMKSSSQVKIKSSSEPALQVYRLYHGSLTDGPGRRSVAQVAGCTLACVGCYAVETHNPGHGMNLTISAVVAELLAAEGGPRDGVTILGGEPFQQPDGLAALLHALKQCGQHLTVYSGYTLEQLRARPEPAVKEALSKIDLLIDGPFIAALAKNAGQWRGSTNQRLIAHPAEAVL